MEVLYSKFLPIRIKHEATQERRANLSVTIEIHNVQSPLPRKELIIRLTEDKDLFFLYSLLLTEEDFQTLKIQQGLLVDFTAFPQKLVDLFELCLREEHRETPKFLLVFSIHQMSIPGSSQAFLEIVETNPFKHLTHLSLKFVQGSDADVKKYLASCLKSLKDNKEHLESLLRTTETTLQQKLYQTEEQLSSKTVELERLKNEWKENASALSSRLTQDVGMEREKALQTQTELQLKCEREKRDLEFRHSSVLQKLESRVTILESQNKELNEKKFHLDSSNRELRSRLASTEDELKYSKQEVKSLRHENSTLDSQLHEREKTVNALNTRVAVLEQELKSKEELNAKQQLMLDTAYEQKRHLEEVSDQRQAVLNKRESTLKQMSNELDKANDIIRKLQVEMRNLHSKLKTRGQIALEQEKVISDRDEKIQQLKDELSSTKDVVKEKTEEAKKLKDELESIQSKVEQCEKQVKTDENVINWLNKQLNEKQMPYVPHSSSVPFSSNLRTSSRLNSLGPPIASSTPQAPFGYFMPPVGQFANKVHFANSPAESLPSSNQQQQGEPLKKKGNKENATPLDPKYYTPSIKNGGNLGGSVPSRRHSSSPLAESTPAASANRSATPPSGAEKKKQTQPLPNSNLRLPKASVVAPINSKVLPTMPPIASAYFPVSSTNNRT